MRGHDIEEGRTGAPDDSRFGPPAEFAADVAKIVEATRKAHSLDGYGCQGITAGARYCKRRARYHYENADGVCQAHYCAQHHAGRGPTRLLRPFAWEYTTVREYSQ